MPAPRPPAKLSPSYLENAALHYLERFAASSASLRRVMMRKVARSLAHWGEEAGLTPHDAERHIDALIGKLTRLGYLNDAQYAIQKARSLNRQGKGQRVIRATLNAKGVEGDDLDQAITALGEDQENPDHAAAVRLARKRRLGPFRRDGRAEARQKDLAALVRAGFDFEIARAVIDAESPEELEASG